MKIDGERMERAIKDYFKGCPDDGTKLDPVDLSRDMVNLVEMTGEACPVEEIVHCNECTYKTCNRDKYGRYALFCSHLLMPHNIAFWNRYHGFGCTLGERRITPLSGKKGEPNPDMKIEDEFSKFFSGNFVQIASSAPVNNEETGKRSEDEEVVNDG